jgi:hypothetical protein
VANLPQSDKGLDQQLNAFKLKSHGQYARATSSGFGHGMGVSPVVGEKFKTTLSLVLL